MRLQGTLERFLYKRCKAQVCASAKMEVLDFKVHFLDLNYMMKFIELLIREDLGKNC